MEKQSARYLFLFSLFVVGMFLFNFWQQEYPNPNIQRVNAEEKSFSHKYDFPEITESPKVTTNLNSAELFAQDVVSKPPDRVISVKTDVFNVKIDLMGGDIFFLELPKYPKKKQDTQEGFLLLDESSERNYVAESGLLSSFGPDNYSRGKGMFSSAQNQYEMKAGVDSLSVDTVYYGDNAVKVIKSFLFERGKYTVNVKYLVLNEGNQIFKGNVFARLKRKEEKSAQPGFMGAMRTYTGAAVTTSDSRYKKISFDDLRKERFEQTMLGGWVAMVEHYFTAAWVPSLEQKNYFEGKKLADGSFGIGFTGSTISVPPGEQKEISMLLYAGPEITETLKDISPGLELTVDYGILWWLCQPIFWLLKKIHEIIGNWGVAIILTTVVIKAVFYKLSAASYRSMGNMRKLQPKIEALKKTYGDDKKSFGKAMMELYRKEKINPLGGCLPILVQIPVFIALYYVLLESVELRQAPFAAWIQDLSAKDPYYILPLIMGASMFIQQRLNPAPPDPIQAKVMMFMPVFFTFLFLQFPSGLVLYWVVNNVLSILQQWMITRMIEQKSA